MSYPKLILAAFIGGLLAIVVVIAWKSSKETGKSVPASIVDVPSETQRLASDARTKVTEKATDARTKVTEKASETRAKVTDKASETRAKVTEKAAAGWETVKEKESALAKRLPGRGDEDTEMVAEAVTGETAETA